MKQARNLVRDARFHAGHLTELHAALGTADYWSGQIRKARQRFRNSLAKPTDNVVAQVRWASGRVSGVAVSEEAWRVPRSFEALCWRALEETRWADAAQACRDWLADEPFSSRPALIGSFIGVSLLGDFRFAEDCARVGLKADREEQTLLNNLVVALAYQGRLKDAEEVFRSVKRQLVESYPEFVYEATSGLLEFRRGRVESGRLSYRKAEELAPANRKGRVLIHWAREEQAAGTAEAPEVRVRAEDLLRRSKDIYAEQIFAKFLG